MENTEHRRVIPIPTSTPWNTIFIEVLLNLAGPDALLRQVEHLPHNCGFFLINYDVTLGIGFVSEGAFQTVGRNSTFKFSLIGHLRISGCTFTLGLGKCCKDGQHQLTCAGQRVDVLNFKKNTDTYAFQFSGELEHSFGISCESGYAFYYD